METPAKPTNEIGKRRHSWWGMIATGCIVFSVIAMLLPGTMKLLGISRYYSGGLTGYFAGLVPEKDEMMVFNYGLASLGICLAIISILFRSLIDPPSDGLFRYIAAYGGVAAVALAV